MNAITTSAPGKLMLMGEHAVLHGRPALVAAVNRRVHVRLNPRADRRVRVQSALGAWEGDLDGLRPVAPFEFVLGAVAAVRPPAGCDLHVQAEFNADVGLGSSAAVTVATVAALQAFAGDGELQREQVFHVARQTVRAVQGAASGADLAAAVYGGVVDYRAAPLQIRPVPGLPPTAVVYSGSKRRTAEVIALVETARRAEPARYEALFDQMAELVEDGAAAIAAGDAARLGARYDEHQQIMAGMGLSNPRLDEIVAALRREPGVHGAKISGAGLGDCVIAAGTLAPATTMDALDVALTQTGVTRR